MVGFNHYYTEKHGDIHMPFSLLLHKFLVAKGRQIFQRKTNILEEMKSDNFAYEEKKLRHM
jgi:hypothetical protein